MARRQPGTLKVCTDLASTRSAAPFGSRLMTVIGMSLSTERNSATIASSIASSPELPMP